MSIELEYIKTHSFAKVTFAVCQIQGTKPDALIKELSDASVDLPISLGSLCEHIKSKGIENEVSAYLRRQTVTAVPTTAPVGQLVEGPRADAAGDGKKWDSGKLLWDLVPFKPIEEFVRVMTYGAEKYGSNNWQGVRPFRARYSAALMRHVVQYMKGETIDPESGIHHLAHAICNCVFLMWGDDNLKEGE